MIRHVAAAFVVLTAGLGSAQAQSFNFEYSTVTPGGQQISVVRLPIKLPNDKIIHRDVIMQFEYRNNTIRFAEGFPKIVESELAEPGPFIAGVYKDPSDREWTLAGPLPGPNGRTRWSIHYSSYSADFYTGVVTGHPFENRIERARINADYNFGAFMDQSFSLLAFGPEDLLALVQVDKRTVQILDFTDDGKDRATPRTVVTFKR